jgi:hypothetical protein
VYEWIMDMWDVKHSDKPIPVMQQKQALAMMQQAYEKMHRALASTHRPIVYSLCQYGIGAAVWDSFRTDGQRHRYDVESEVPRDFADDLLAKLLQIVDTIALVREPVFLTSQKNRAKPHGGDSEFFTSESSCGHRPCRLECRVAAFRAGGGSHAA